MRQIKRTIYDEGHPSNHFEIGSLETLEKVDRQVLLDFHEKYYSANQMALALLSKYSLDEMEVWAHKYFSGIKNTDAPDIDYPPVYLSEKQVAYRLISRFCQNQLIGKSLNLLNGIVLMPEVFYYHVDQEQDGGR